MRCVYAVRRVHAVTDVALAACILHLVDWLVLYGAMDEQLDQGIVNSVNTDRVRSSAPNQNKYH